MGVGDTVLDLSVDGNVWSGGNSLDSSASSGRLSDNSVTVLDADSDSSGLDSAVTQSKTSVVTLLTGASAVGAGAACRAVEVA